VEFLKVTAIAIFFHPEGGITRVSQACLPKASAQAGYQNKHESIFFTV
jgi:hypothetical protein